MIGGIARRGAASARVAGPRASWRTGAGLLIALCLVLGPLAVLWGLTPAEHDVAMMLIKGAPIAEIARLRQSAEGTVKAHCNRIYAKSGGSGRTELVSQFVDDLMDHVHLENNRLFPRFAADLPAAPVCGGGAAGG